LRVLAAQGGRGEKAELPARATRARERDTQKAAILSLIVDCDKEAKNRAQEIGKAGDEMRRALEVQIADAKKRCAALTKERCKLESLLDTRRLTEGAVRTTLQFWKDVVTRMQDPL